MSFFHHRTIAPRHHTVGGQASDHRTVVIGGGIAGLTCAYRLKNAGLNVLLLEQAGTTGGCIRTRHEQGYLLELGPNTILNSSAELWGLAGELGLRHLKVETPEAVGQKRYIFKKGRLINIPAGPGILFSKALSIKGRLRLLAEPFIKSPLPPFTKGGREGILHDESLASFIRRRLGNEVLDNLVTPFVSGIWAGDPEKLSARATFPKLVEAEQKYGGLFKGMRHLKGEVSPCGLGSFAAGIGTLPANIEARLGDAVIKNARVVSVAKLNNAYKVCYERNGLQEFITARAVVCATPSYTTARILPNLDKTARIALAHIEYGPIVVVHTGYHEDDVPRRLEGFGFLAPRKNRVRMLGSLWSSSLFPGRAPEDHVLLTNFMGGMLDLEACDLTNEDIMSTVQKDLARTLGIRTTPAFACITCYTHAIPQYNLGHLGRIEKIEDELERHKGLFLTGSYFTGISVAATIGHANAIADNVIHYL